jgi:hypothetical protein
LYYKDHPTCFEFGYDLQVFIDDGEFERYWMGRIFNDPNLEYPNSPALAVNRNREVDVRFSYTDKNPQIGPTEGSFRINTGSHSTIYISFFAVSSHPCYIRHEICHDLVTFEIDESMKCEEGIDSIYVAWVYK